MVEQTLNRYPGPAKDRLASENFRVSRNHVFHANIIARPATLCEPKLLPSLESNNEVICRFQTTRKLASLLLPQQAWILGPFTSVGEP